LCRTEFVTFSGIYYFCPSMPLPRFFLSHCRTHIIPPLSFSKTPIPISLPPTSLTFSTFDKKTFLEPPKTPRIMATTKTGDPLDRGTLDTLLRRRLFYVPSFELYGGVSGLYDYGPAGCFLQANIIDAWREHFVFKEKMLQVDCAILTPHDVLKTSGHVDKFADWMCKDTKTGEIFRADHIVEEILEARLKGDKEARGAKIVEEEDADKKKRKKKLKDIQAIKLDDKVVQEYQEILAKVGGHEPIH